MEHKRRKSEELIEAPILELQGSKFLFFLFFFSSGQSVTCPASPAPWRIGRGSAIAADGKGFG
jgi:hypothetical protein